MSSLGIFRFRGDREPFIFDLTAEISINRTAQVASASVEYGSAVTDHVRLEPVVINFRGILVNEPTDSLEARARANAAGAPAEPGLLERVGAALFTRTFDDPLQRARLAGPAVDPVRAGALLAKLIEIHEDKIPVVVVTPRDEYEGMILQSLVEIPAGAQGIEVSGTLHEIRFATTRFVNLAPEPADSQRHTKPGKDVGTKAAPEAAEAVKKGLVANGRDVLVGVFEALGGGG